MVLSRAVCPPQLKLSGSIFADVLTSWNQSFTSAEMEDLGRLNLIIVCLVVCVYVCVCVWLGVRRPRAVCSTSTPNLLGIFSLRGRVGDGEEEREGERLRVLYKGHGRRERSSGRKRMRGGERACCRSGLLLLPW